MIVFIEEDHAYRQWLLHHRTGFVVEARWRGRRGNGVLHRACCKTIRPAGKHGHATTGGRAKACAVDVAELHAWSAEQFAKPLAQCPACQPLHESPDSAPAAAPHEPATRLCRAILDYVVEAAVLHLESTQGPRYRLTAGDIATCLGKTVGQISHALEELAAEKLIALPGKPIGSGRLPSTRMVLPTAQALLLLPSFSAEEPQAVQRQLDLLLAPRQCPNR